MAEPNDGTEQRTLATRYVHHLVPFNTDLALYVESAEEDMDLELRSHTVCRAQNEETGEQEMAWSLLFKRKPGGLDETDIAAVVHPVRRIDLGQFKDPKHGPR